ncbi:unnamed protein product, partial [Amoebophrya sp. A25]
CKDCEELFLGSTFAFSERYCWRPSNFWVTDYYNWRGILVFASSGAALLFSCTRVRALAYSTSSSCTRRVRSHYCNRSEAMAARDVR